MSLLIAYEDHYCQELDRTLRRVVKRDGDLSVPREFHPVDGVTNFPPFVRGDWRRFRDRGFPVKGKPRPTALLCIADADKVVNQLGLAARTRPYHDWIVRAEGEFTNLLRKETDRPEQVHGALLRWNLESTLLAAYDEPEAMQRLAGAAPLDAKGLEAFLTRCTPDPRTVSDDAFTDVFETSQKCLAELGHSMGWRILRKGDVRKDDALSWISDQQLDKLVRRVPDLRRIAQHVREVARGLSGS
jgi:hypothetical protein